MLIRVQYKNGQEDAVEDSQLEDLIKSNKIIKFMRSDGWCTIGVDPIRKESSTEYKGPERRRNV
jgi:hypothetical protein